MNRIDEYTHSNIDGTLTVYATVPQFSRREGLAFPMRKAVQRINCVTAKEARDIIARLREEFSDLDGEWVVRVAI